MLEARGDADPSKPALAGVTPTLLEALAAWLDTDGSSPFEPELTGHEKAWLEQGVAVPRIFEEYALLRQSVAQTLRTPEVTIEPGELVVVCGRNGSGKSTLLKLIDGLHAPSAGSIRIDGIDYRQIAADDLRSAIAYTPQVGEFFHGTVLQNFRLVAPEVEEVEVRAALAAMHLEEEIGRLPEGLETRLSEDVRRQMSRATFQALVLARSLVRRGDLHLFDEPCSGLDGAREAAFLRRLQDLRGRRTVVMVSDRPSHFRLADRLVMLDRGRVVVNETGEAGLGKVRARFDAITKG